MSLVIFFQFQRCDPKDDKITEKQFAKILLLYAGMNEVKRKKMMKRIQQKFEGESQVRNTELWQGWMIYLSHSLSFMFHFFLYFT